MENKAHQQGTPGCKPGEPHFPRKSGVCPPHWRPQIHLPLPPTPSQPVWGVHTLPRGTGSQQHHSHNTPLCQGIFSNCSQTLYGICGEVLSNSGESCSRIVSKGDDKLREVAQPPSILDSTAAQNASFAISPPLHLTNAGCPSEWLSPPAQPCSLLRFSLLPLGLEEPQPP